MNDEQVKESPVLLKAKENLDELFTKSFNSILRHLKEIKARNGSYPYSYHLYQYAESYGAQPADSTWNTMYNMKTLNNSWNGKYLDYSSLSATFFGMLREEVSEIIDKLNKVLKPEGFQVRLEKTEEKDLSFYDIWMNTEDYDLIVEEIK